MNNSIYDRMRALLENSGLKFCDNGITNAEIEAYSKGLDMVQKQFAGIYRQIFINLEESDNADKYIELLNLSTENLSMEEIKSEIKRRLGETFGHYTIEDFNHDFYKVGSGTYTWTSKFGLEFIDISINDLERLGRFVMPYTVLHANLGYWGDGFTFDQWDKYAQTFYKYDKLNLPFDIIDNFRSDMIE